MTQQAKTLEQRLRRHVYRLADEIGEHNVYHPEALHAAERYILQSFEAEGYEVTRQEYRVKDVTAANLEVDCPGTKYPEEIILVGAHYDSVIGSPGANDNGSGVAALLELSRMFRTAAPERTVRLVAFVNEEPPFFLSPQQGSMVYSKMVRRRGDNIRLMISLETVGYYRDTPGSQHYPPLLRRFYPSTANFIAFVSNLRSRRIMRRFARAFREVSDFPLEHLATFSLVPGVAWSDHLSFWWRGYRAMMVTDTAFYRYPYYHTAGDTAEKLDYEKLAMLTESLYAALMKFSAQPL
jgi:Zn-dependent M28 family amino/carboxypeptidase